MKLFRAFLSNELLPRMRAGERTVYRAAVRRPKTELVVRALVSENRSIAWHGGRLATEAGPEAAATAEAIRSLFAVHVAKENYPLLCCSPPCSPAGPWTWLAGLPAQMQDHAGHDEVPAPAAAGQPGDAPAAVVSLLLQAAAVLARTGEADRACKIAASAWAAPRDSRPDLASR